MTHNEDFVDFAVEDSPEDLDEDPRYRSTALDSATVHILSHTLLDERKESRLEIIHPHQVHFLVSPVLQILLLQTHRLKLE